MCSHTSNDNASLHTTQIEGNTIENCVIYSTFDYHDTLPCISLNIQRNNVIALLDTGSIISLIAQQHFNLLKPNINIHISFS